ncbi:IF-2-associated domain-containing protein, partial [Sphingomonas sp. KR1UV-12]
MSDTDNDKPKLGMRAPLGLRRTVETGKVKQSFSHGRSNTVIVETKKARTFRRPGEAAPAAEAPLPEVAAPAPVQQEAPRPAPRPAPSNETPQERQARMLREAEEQRMHALEDARRREDAERARLAQEERARAAAPPPPPPVPEPEPAPAPVQAAEPVAPSPTVPTPAGRGFRPVERPVPVLSLILI